MTVGRERRFQTFPNMLQHPVQMYGADVIKTCATGGVLSEGDAVGVP